MLKEKLRVVGNGAALLSHGSYRAEVDGLNREGVNCGGPNGLIAMGYDMGLMGQRKVASETRLNLWTIWV